MNTPITYYGGKQTMSDMIISMIPKHKIYCEPYFGGGAVFFRKNKSYLEAINDIDDKLINFYQVTQNNFNQLKKLIDQTLNSEKQYLFAKDIWNNRVSEVGNIEKAWAIWLITNGSFGGSMHGGWKWSNGSQGSHTGIYIENKRKQFSIEIHNRLKNVQISCRDALKVIPERDSEETFFYIDPPYPGSYQGHYTGYSHKDLYKLLEVLSQIKGKFILSQYFSTTLKYFIIKMGWNYKTIETTTRVASFNNKPTSRTEILTYNFKLDNGLFTEQDFERL